MLTRPHLRSTLIPYTTLFRSKETESKKPSKQKTVKKEQERKETEEKSTAISIDEAVDIALSKFTGQVTEVEVEEEDGRLIYEVEIESGEEEAEIEIDAHTGEVSVIEIDRDERRASRITSIMFYFFVII